MPLVAAAALYVKIVGRIVNLTNKRILKSAPSSRRAWLMAPHHYLLLCCTPAKSQGYTDVLASAYLF